MFFFPVWKHASTRKRKHEDSTQGLSSGSGIYRANPGVTYKAKVRKNTASLYLLPLFQNCFTFQRAKGDVKKAGQLDPYAYIPLNREKLNRRKRVKMSGEFSGIMKKAVKGSKAGTKSRHRKK